MKSSNRHAPGKINFSKPSADKINVNKVPNLAASIHTPLYEKMFQIKPSKQISYLTSNSPFLEPGHPLKKPFIKKLFLKNHSSSNLPSRNLPLRNPPSRNQSLDSSLQENISNEPSNANELRTLLQTLLSPTYLSETILQETLPQDTFLNHLTNLPSRNLPSRYLL